jgi:hypothetical protein
MDADHRRMALKRDLRRGSYWSGPERLNEIWWDERSSLQRFAIYPQ